MRLGFGAVAAVLAGAMCIAAEPALADPFERMMRGESAIQGKKLEKAIAKADQHPLGSKDNPVRVTMPQGQRLYLSRLRCSDGAPPRFQRAGSVGSGPFGNIVDLYKVTCPGAQPAESDIYMDMYHGGYIESRIVPGFAAEVPLEVPLDKPSDMPVKAGTAAPDPAG